MIYIKPSKETKNIKDRCLYREPNDCQKQINPLTSKLV